MLNASRSSGEPHHHARQAALLNKNSTAAVAIAGGVNPNSYQPTNSLHRKDGPTAEALERRNEAGALERQDWTALDLGGQGLHALSNTLFTYTFLDKLYINHNKLTKLPAAIGRLKLLQLLDASSNQLTELPPELGMLTNLRQLLLFDNNLTALPYEVGSLYQLDVIGLEGNPLGPEYQKVMMEKGTRELVINLRDSMPGRRNGSEARWDVTNERLVTTPPVDRDWIVLDDTVKPDSDADNDKFIVVSYNILCDRYATQNLYGYTASWALEWGYRKELIKRELLESNADIICLQELDLISYEDYFAPELARADYTGMFAIKTRARTMPENEKKTVDGCATFYRKSK